MGLGKFAACLAQPMANLHYIIAPVGVLQKRDLPERWGLLTYGTAGVCVVVRAMWQESTACQYVEGAIARTLTGDIYRADDRAINSVNREIFAQQQQLAERIRSLKENIVLAGTDEENVDEQGTEIQADADRPSATHRPDPRHAETAARMPRPGSMPAPGRLR